MPAKKKAASNPNPVVVETDGVVVEEIEIRLPSFEKAVLSLGADFPCEVSLAAAKELYEKHGEAFVAAIEAHGSDPIPISVLKKVIGPTLRGRPPTKKANDTFKDRWSED